MGGARPCVKGVNTCRGTPGPFALNGTMQALSARRRAAAQPVSINRRRRAIERASLDTGVDISTFSGDLKREVLERQYAQT